jgi:RimJ/RimL family protein N-acetyltransferase
MSVHIEAQVTNIPIQIETPRLLLRQWRAADRGPCAALNADPIVMAHFPKPLTHQESEAMADRCERLIAERGWGVWATEIRTTGEFIGFVGLHVARDDLPVSPCVEILWRLARAHWGQGLATEAARGALRIGFEVLPLTEIVSFTVPANTRSRAVMERLGMQMDAATFEHPDVPDRHVLRTHVNYRLSRDRWLSIRPGEISSMPVVGSVVFSSNP